MINVARTIVTVALAEDDPRNLGKILVKIEIISAKLSLCGVFTYSSYSWCGTFRRKKNILRRNLSHAPKLGVFSWFFKFSIFVGLLLSSRKNYNQQSLHEQIKNILPFVLKTKQPLRDMWLPRYWANNFIDLWRKWKSVLF